jgi:hypothetical protein
MGAYVGDMTLHCSFWQKFFFSPTLTCSEEQQQHTGICRHAMRRRKMQARVSCGG